MVFSAIKSRQISTSLPALPSSPGSRLSRRSQGLLPIVSVITPTSSPVIYSRCAVTQTLQLSLIGAELSSANITLPSASVLSMSSERNKKGGVYTF
ncbi:hypothetical protein J6590_027324 [Homalodisca vitripennis]|nr:hypothetical protein J6590_027324 [Homalodisca vitripennis]